MQGTGSSASRSRRGRPRASGQACTARAGARMPYNFSTKKSYADAFQKQNRTRARMLSYTYLPRFSKKGKRKPSCHFPSSVYSLPYVIIASCCDYIICAHSVNFVHLTCRCEMSCMSGSTDCGGPKICTLNTDTYVGKIMKLFLPKSPRRLIFSENWSYTYLKNEFSSQDYLLLQRVTIMCP